VSKYAELSRAILAALDHEDYLVYALCGRALIETVAHLRYYVVHKYKPLFEKKHLDQEDLRTLLETDDVHLRGGRFDWESFMLGRYTQMKEDAIKELNAKGKKSQQKQEQITNYITAQQVSVLTCIKHWAAETPAILIVYNLFCDLVHPNVGSIFLVSSHNAGKVYFSKGKGDNAGHHIVEHSLPMLASVTHKPFGELVTWLMAARLKEDEFNQTDQP
jgi:hypothetical protein